MIIDFTPENDGDRAVLEAMNRFPSYSLERAEVEGHLYTVLARVAWRDADRLRELARRMAKRKR